MAIALGHFNGVVGLYSGDEASGMKDAKAAALEWSARCYMGVQRDCDAHDQYEELLRLRHGSIAMLQPPSRLLHAAVATNCDPARALVLWDLLSDAGELDAIAEPTKCKTCWNKMDIARRVAKEHALGESKSNIARGAPPLWRWNDAAVEADAYFEEHVGPNTPWVHASQTPSEFDLALATSEPQGWHRPADHRVCAMLQEHSVTIMAEYVAWEGAFFSGHFDAEHDDAALVAKAARGWEGETEAPWQYLHLRRLRYGSRGEEPNWDEELCAKHFPETCAALRGLAEVDGSPTQPCKDGWCRGIHEVQSGQLLWQKPGLVAFYRLAPGVEVPLHSGPTNRRLKCQLVIRADGSEPSEGGSAWIEVNGIARRVLRGDVLAFDDSYLHRVANSDGASGSRVVLDVGCVFLSLFLSSLSVSLTHFISLLPPPPPPISLSLSSSLSRPFFKSHRFWHPKVKPALHTDGMFQPNLETFSTDIEEGALHHPEPEAEERSEL